VAPPAGRTRSTVSRTFLRVESVVCRAGICLKRPISRAHLCLPRARAHTQNGEQRENHKASLQSNLEFNSIVRRCTHRGRKCARGASPERPRDLHIHIHTHWNMCGSVLCLVRAWRSIGRGPPAGQLPTADTVALSTVRLQRVARSLACSNKIRTIAGEQLAAPPTINGSLRQSPFFSLRPPLTIETNCALAAVPLLQCRKP
jgi:hypothetical protein